MKSKPVYGSLDLDVTAAKHFVIVQGQGIDAATRLLSGNPATQFRLHTLDDETNMASHLRDVLKETTVGTAFYVAGSERFLWDVTRHLRDAGVDRRRIRQEIAGSLARKVYCVHCQTMNDLVTTTVHWCIGCGMALTVRDHFSRPLGAYQGVIVDAESPGDVPIPEVLYR